MIISVASGKGGTGKTTVATNLALSIENAEYYDCDVEEPNGHLFLKPVISEEKNAVMPCPTFDENSCSFCGKCRDICSYNAIAVLPGENGREGKVLHFQHLCHGCGACGYFCPENAITEIDKPIGVIQWGQSGSLNFNHAKLNIGEIMSPAVIRQLKKSIQEKIVTIIDSPPGTSCPVISAVKGSDYCILVTEPTPFGLNDLKLAVEVIEKLGIPFGVVINKSDTGDGKTEEYCNERNIPILLKIPFSRELARLYSSGEPVAAKNPGYRDIFRKLYTDIEGTLS